MDKNCRIVIDHIAQEGSFCEICGKPAHWQMYCQDCGNILRFYCDEHAYLSHGDEKLERQVKKAYKSNKPLKLGKETQKAMDEWQLYVKNDQANI